jgi:hypothetical protein
LEYRVSRAASTAAGSPPSRSRRALSRSVGTGGRAEAPAAQRPARLAARCACARSAPAPRAAPTRGLPAWRPCGSESARPVRGAHFVKTCPRGEIHAHLAGNSLPRSRISTDPSSLASGFPPSATPKALARLRLAQPSRALRLSRAVAAHRAARRGVLVDLWLQPMAIAACGYSLWLQPLATASR